MAIRIERDDDDEIKGDMTPMIDIIFLLLIFLILTTKFIPDEKAIASLLPTDKGQAMASVKIEEPQNVNILIYPAGFTRGFQPSHYDQQWHANPKAESAIYRVSNRPEIQIDGRLLASRSENKENEQLSMIHAYIHQHLAEFEKGAPTRKDEDPIIIHCFSGLPWKFALAAYDAVREWEKGKFSGELTPEAMLNAREVTFAPPRIRDYREWEMGYELFEIIHLK